MRLAVTFMALGIAAGAACGAAAMHLHHQDQPALPYTKPHQEFTTNQGEKCAGWRFANGAVVAICEGRPPVLRMPKRKCGLDL